MTDLPTRKRGVGQRLDCFPRTEEIASSSLATPTSTLRSPSGQGTAFTPRHSGVRVSHGVPTRAEPDDFGYPRATLARTWATALSSEVNDTFSLPTTREAHG